MVLRYAPLLLMACLPGGRELVEVPVELSAFGIPEAIGEVSLTLETARISVADLVLRDRDGAILGAWAGLRAADLLGTTGQHGIVQIYEGTFHTADFMLDGDPWITLSGTATLPDGTEVPFQLDQRGPAPVERVVASLVIDEDRPPQALTWRLDLELALAEVDWSTPRVGGRPLSAEMGNLGEQLTAGFTDPTAWLLGGRNQEAL